MLTIICSILVLFMMQATVDLTVQLHIVYVEPQHKYNQGMSNFFTTQECSLTT